MDTRKQWTNLQWINIFVSKFDATVHIQVKILRLTPSKTGFNARQAGRQIKFKIRSKY